MVEFDDGRIANRKLRRVVLDLVGGPVAALEAQCTMYRHWGGSIAPSLPWRWVAYRFSRGLSGIALRHFLTPENISPKNYNRIIATFEHSLSWHIQLT